MNLLQIYIVIIFLIFFPESCFGQKTKGIKSYDLDFAMGASQYIWFGERANDRNATEQLGNSHKLTVTFNPIKNKLFHWGFGLNAFSTKKKWSNFQTKSNIETHFDYYVTSFIGIKKKYKLANDWSFAPSFYTGLNFYLLSNVKTERVWTNDNRETMERDIERLEYYRAVNIPLIVRANFTKKINRNYGLNVGFIGEYDLIKNFDSTNSTYSRWYSINIFLGLQKRI